MELKYYICLTVATCCLMTGCGAQRMAQSSQAHEDVRADAGNAGIESYVIRCDRDLDGEACLTAGILLSRVLVIDEYDPDRASFYYQKGCFLGEGEACGRLGDLKLTALAEADEPAGAEQIEEGLSLLKRGCTRSARRSGLACQKLGYYYEGLYELGQGVNMERAVRYYAQGCTLGSGEACGWAADLLWDQGADQDEMIRTYARGCELEDGSSCASLGFIHATGIGAPDGAWDDGQAESYYRRACDLGYAVGCTDLGLFYAGQAGDGNAHGSLDAFETACWGGDARGCTLLAEIYAAAGDNDQAQALHARACELGKADMCLHLAGQYDRAQDAVQAEHFRAQACSLGEHDVCLALGRAALERGDEVKAWDYYDTACDAENAVGCSWLGYIYAVFGQDAAAAIRAFDKSCTLGHAQSCTWLGHVRLRSDRDISGAAADFRLGCALGDLQGCQEAARMGRGRH